MVTRLFPYIRSWLLLCLVLLAPLGRALAQNGLQVSNLQVPLGTTPSSFTQNFNALPVNGTAAVVAGLLGNVDGTYTNQLILTSTDGNSGSLLGVVNGITTGLYSFGTTNSSDRALGSRPTGVLSGLLTIRYGVLFRNTTGYPLSSIQVSYNGEQWYKGANGAQTLTVDYARPGTGFNLVNALTLLTGDLVGVNYTSASGLNFSSPVTTGSSRALDGNAAGNRTAITSTITFATPLANNEYVLLRWTDVNDGATLNVIDLTDDHGLAIDDVVISANVINTAPTATALANQTVTVGNSVSISTASAFTDPESQPLSFSATGLPTGLAINSSTGAITGTTSTTGAFPITVRVSDPLGLTASSSFTLTVQQLATNVSTGGPTCAGQNLTLSGLLPVGLPVGAMVVLKGPNNFSVVVGGSGVVSIPTGTGGLPSGNYNLTLVASVSLPLVGTVELLNLPVPVSILPLPALPTGLASQTAAVSGLPLNLTGVCEVGSVLNFVTSTGLSGSSATGIIPVNVASSGIQTVTALCVNVTSGCLSPSQLLNINVLNLVGDAINALPTDPVCLGQPLNLSLLGTGLLGDLTSSLLSLSIAGPNGFLVTTSSPGSVLSLTGLPAGTYSLTITGRLVPVVGVPITVPPIQVPVTVISLAPVTGILASNTVVQNGMLTLIGGCQTGILSYSSASGSGTAISGIGIPIPTGTTGIQSLTVVCLDPNGCLSVPTVANINVLAPVLNVVQGALGCIGQATSLTLLPTNFLLSNPLVNVGISGPAGVTVGALGGDGVVTISGLTSTTTTLTVSVSIAGTQVLSLPVSVSALPLPALPNLPTTLTALAGAPLSLSGLCPTGTLGTLSNLTQGIIPVNTSVPGVQSLSIICNNGGCISPTQILNLSILTPILDVVQGALACVGQATSLTLLPTNFGLTDPLVGVGITGPAGVTVGALGSNGVVSIGGLSTTATTLMVSLSIAGTQILNLPISVSALPLPALPNLPTTLTALAGAPLSLSGLCPTGTLGTLSNLTQGIIPINTTTAGVQTLSLICNNGTCISPTQILSLSVLQPVLNVVQGALACVGQATSLTLLPTNFLLSNPLVNVGISGPAGVTVGALGSNGVVSIGGLSTTATTLTVSLSVAGTQVLSLPVSVSALPLPALPNLPTTLTTLVGSTLSLSGLCPTGTLGTLSNLTQGIIPINTTTAGVQTLSLICNNGTCISPTQILNLSVIGGSLIPGAISPICLGQVLNLPLTGSGPLSDLTSNLVSLSVTGPVNLTTTVLGPGLIRISGLTAGTNNLTITPSVSNIPLAPITVPVNVISLSAVTGLLPTQSVIQNTTLTLAGTCPTGGILSYTNSAGSSGTALSGTGIPVPTNILGGQSYTVVCTDANGCISPATVANLSVVSPLLNVLQGPLVCVGQPVSLTLLPTNFGLTDPLVNVAITGPTGVTASAVGSNGVVTLSGLSSATTTLAVSVSVAGIQVLNQPLTVNSLPLPAAPNLPATLTALTGSTLSLSGLCPTGTLGTLLQPLQGIINVPTTTTGIQSLTLTCTGANGCISPTSIVNLSVVSPLLNTLTNSPICLGSPLALTLVPLNFGINDGVVSLSVTGPVNSTVSAIGPNGVVSIGGLPAGTSTITVTARIAGITVNTITIPVSVLSTPAPSVTTVSGQTAYAGGQTAVSVTVNSGNVLFQGSCQSGVLSYTGSVGGAVNTGAQTSFITVPTTTTGVFTYTAICVNGACISTGTVVSVSVVNATPTNQSPTLVGGGIPSPQSATVNIGFSLPAANYFTDPNGDPLTYAASGLPAGLSITPSTGVISGVPSVSGTFPVSVTANDGKGGTVSSSFILNVAPAAVVNQPPFLSSALPTPQSATVGVAFSTTTAGAFTDPNGDPLSFTATGLPTGLVINPTTGVISGVPAVSGTTGVIVTVSDGKGGTAQGFFILNVAPAPVNNTPPTLVGGGIPSPQSATVGVAFSTTTAGAFFDANGDPLSFTATGLPAGLGINPATGVISGVPTTSGLAGVAVTASDGKGGSVTSTFILNVFPAPAGNLPPNVVGGGIPTPQSATVGFAYSTTTAGAFSDPNGDPLSFTATGLPTGVTINPTTGFISGVPSVSGTFGIVVTANDGKGGIAQAVYVLNVAPAPTTNTPPTLVGNIPSPQSATVGVAFSTTTAGAFFDPNGDPLTFSLNGQPGGLSIDPASGVISGVPSVSGNFPITVTANDGKGGTAQAIFVLNVSPAPAVNLPPVLLANLPSPQSATVGVAFSTTTAGAFSDPNGDPLTFSASNLPNGLTMGLNNGIISGTPSVSGTFGVIVTASDGRGGSVQAALVINVVPAAVTNLPPSIVGNGILSPQSATVGVAFSTTTAGACSDPTGAPLSFAASGLPAGLAISPTNGVISGIPSVSGTFPVSVSASDGRGGTAQSFFILNVSPAPAINLPPVIVGNGIPSPQSATVTIAFSTTTAGAFSDPNGDPLSFTATGLPTGLAISPGTGLISGVPSVSGSFGIVVTASDGRGGTAQAAFVLNVVPLPATNLPPSVIASLPSPQSGTVNVAFSTTTAGAFSDPNGDPLTFSTTGLPSGLAINPTTGVISGVPTQSGSFGVTVFANDGKGGTASAPFTLNISPAPAINLPPLAGVIPSPQSTTVGVVFSTTTAGAFFDPNGDALTFSTSGLPTGLSINPATGLISGIASQSGVFGIVVTANDNRGGSAQAFFFLNVAPAPTVNVPPALVGNGLPSPQSATVGVAFSTTTAGAFFDANGDPLTFSVAGLPAGLNITPSTGVISGVPSVSGTFPVSVTANDGKGGFASSVFILNVSPAAVVNQPPTVVGNGLPSPQSATVGIAFSTTTAGAFTDPNGDPLTFSAQGLPTGLSIIPSTGVISGVPSVTGSFGVIVTANDGKGGTAQAAFILNVVPAPVVNQPPTLVGNGIPSPQSATVNVAFSTTTAGAFTDPNGDPLTFSANGLPAGLSIIPSTGVITGVPSASGTFGVTVIANDGKGGSASSTFILNVFPAQGPNLPPVIVGNGLPSPQSATVGLAFSTTTAGAFSDPNGDPLTFSAQGLPNGLSINPTTGQITGVPTTAGNYGIIVTAGDGKGGTAQAAFILNVVPAPSVNRPPTVVGNGIPSPQSATVNIAFSTTTAGAFSDPDGDPLSFSATGLPTGLSIIPSTGLITGVPSVSGTYAITVFANDGKGGTASSIFVLNVLPAPSVNLPPSVVGNGIPSPQSATVGVAFSTTTAGAFADPNGDPLTFAAQGIPTGLAINPSTGLISGVPSVSGTYGIIVTASDGRGGSAQAAFILTVFPAPTVNNPPTLVGNGIPSPQSATVGIGFSSPVGNFFTDANGDPLTFAVSGLPAGLSINASTGVISGVPSVSGTFPVTVTASDGKGGSVSSVFILNVVPAAVINQPPVIVGNGIPSPQSATVTIAFSTTTAGAFSDPNGDPLTFSSTGLPTGLLINPNTGVISGVPSVTGNFGVIVTASDGKGGSASAPFVLNVVPLPAVNQPPVLVGGGIPSPQSATVNVAFSTTTAGAFSDPNGDPLTFTATGLPTGLAINPNTGIISGIPSVSGTFPITVVANDGKGGSATSIFILNVAPAPVASGPLSVTVAAYDCVTGAITFGRVGGDPNRTVEYLALNATSWTTSPFANLGPDVRNDPTMTSIVVFARYVGDASSIVSFTFNFRTFCGSQGNGAPVYNGLLANQVGTVGTSFTYTFPANAFTDPEGQALTYTSIGLPPGLSLNGRTISGIPQLQGTYAVTIMAQDPQGASVNGTFTFTVNPAPVVGTPLTVTVVSYNCQTGAITFGRIGGDPNRTVEYFAIGVRLNNATPYSTNPNGTIESELRNDQNQSTITVMARYVNDPASTVSFVYNFRTPCAGQTPNQPPVYNGGLQNLAGTVGVPFSYTLPKTLFTDPENQSITLGAGGLPPGIILIDNVISGTPTAAGIYEPVYIFGFDPQRLFATGTFRFTVNIPTAGNQAPIVTGSIPNQTATVGIFYTYTIPSNVFRDPENQALTYSISGAPRRLDVNGNVISGFPLLNGSYPITVTARDPQGASNSVTYILTVLPNPGCGSDPNSLGQPLELLQPTYSCATGVIKFNTRGGNGSTITYAAIGITVPTTDCYDQMDTEVAEDVRNDKPNVQPFIIRATQNGVVVQYAFDARAYCRAGGREAAGVTQVLEVTVLGNPTNSDAVEVDIRGAEGEALRLRVADPTGNAISEQHVDQASATERVRVPLSRAAGVYLLQVNTANRTKVVKIVRQ